MILYPPIGSKLFPFILLPPFVAELALASWLLIKAVDLSEWRKATFLRRA